MGRTGGRPATGSVTSTWRRSGVTSSSNPAIAPTARDQAPAAQMTVPVSTRPREVSTARTSPSSISMSSTAQPVTIVAPCARAAVA